jgi:hypothetical protein
MANEKDYKPEGSGTAGKVKEGDDLSTPAKDNLGSYLSSLTKSPDTKNAFPIEDNPRVETSLRGSSGLPAAFKTGGEDSTQGFTSQSSEDAISNFETLSNSGKITKLSDVLNKNSRKDGHSLLRDVVSNRAPGEPGVGDSSGASAIKSPAKETQVQKKISSMLKEGNRFDPTPGSSPYIEDGQFTEPGIPITQGGFGIYDDDAVRTSLADLHKIAHSMMVRSTGHRMSNSSDPDGGSEISTTDVQKGTLKVSTEDLRPTNVYASPAKVQLLNAELRYDDVTGGALGSQKSFGSLSSYREPFEYSALANLNTAVQALGEYLLGAAVFTAVITLVELLEKLEDPHNPKAPNTLKKGMWHSEGTILRILRQAGFPNLNRPAWKCAIYGLAAWLKLPPSALPDASDKAPSPIPGIPGIPGITDGMGSVAAWFAGIAASSDDILFNALYGSGYYANTMRVVRRDLDRMLDTITLADTGTTSGPDGARAIFDMIMNLGRYPAWNFFVAILRMGDAWLNSYNKHVKFGSLSTLGQTRVQMSRQPGSNKQAWRHSSSPALVLLNEKYLNAATAFGYHPKFLVNLHSRIGDNNSRTPDSPYWENLRIGGNNRGTKNGSAFGGIRYSKEDRIAIENELDAEYCPFYFHDLRTNEIISFHAFLRDIKDSYSVGYAESAGYGRIDKVKIYQDTTRSVSLSWTLVATSPEDFDSMWWSVNKLVSMLYPSFSLGKPVNAGNKKFVMPFSQIPTASPVIRLRVGDIIRSNYSRFNLARIFGLSEIKLASPDGTGSGELSKAAFSVAEVSPAAVTAAKEDAAKKEKDATKEAVEKFTLRFSQEPSSMSDDKHGFIPGSDEWGYAILKPSSEGYTTYDTASGKTITLESSTRTASNNHSSNPPPAGATHVESKSFPSRPSTSGRVKILERIVRDPGEAAAAATGDDSELEGSIAEYYVQYVDQDDPADPYGKASKKGHFHTYIVTSQDLSPIMPAVAKVEASDPLIDLDAQINSVNQFFDPKNNAIVRSFEAAGGRGLAGVITSMDFDWNEAQWDMSSIGRRAPTMLTVSIAFSPIHDIIPGLDSNGMMRAMNYPVGSLAGPLGTDYHDPGGVRSPVANETSESDGVSVTDARSTNYDGFLGSIDRDGEGGS